MLRGWNGNGDAETQPQCRGSDDAEADEALRPENNEVDISTEDPLASPGNSSLNSGHFGGWSIGPGMVDKESVDINPYDDDDEEYESEEVTKNKRSSSPRESHFTAHGLSMVKEDIRRSDTSSPNSPGTNNFDDVDLEAFPLDSPTTRDVSRQNNSSTNGNHYGMKGNIANRVVQEFQTNPKFKFQVLVALSMLLVASCLIAVLVVAPDENRQSVKNEQDKAVDLSALLDGLQSSTHKPTSRPTKALFTTPVAKQPTPPQVVLTEYPTLLPTMYPTFSTLKPSADTIAPSKTSKPYSLADANVTLTTSSPSSLLTSTVPLQTLKPTPTPNIPTLQPSSIQITVTPTRDCSDSSGEFMTYSDKPHTCEWLDNGFNGAKSDRKDMNCKKSDLGDACKYTCRLYNGCMEYFLHSTEDFNSERDFSIGDPCADKEGSFISDGDVPRTCKWLDEDPETVVKKDLNCGTHEYARTELGTMCPGSCAGYNACKSAADGKDKKRTNEEVNDDSTTRFKVDAHDDRGANESTDTPTFFPTAGELNNAGDASIITIAAIGDSTVSQKDDDENFGGSKRLNVEYDADGNTSKERQALLKFDLSSATEYLGKNEGKATLHVFSVTGAESGGIILKKMSSSDWTENDVKWTNVPGGDGSDELIVSSLDKLESNTWYDIDVTAAVRDAIKNKETYLGIRIVSDESVDLYLGSKEREKEQPVLIIDPNAAPPPTETPTSSPTVLLDCMDQTIDFQAHTGEIQECSWMNSGDEAHKKELNCQDEGEAAFICQASCSMYNGCEDLRCIDLSGNYASHNGWTAPCSWLQTEEGMLALELNCGGSGGYEITELGKRCQASCGKYNGCSEKATTKQLDGVPVEAVDTSSSPTTSITALDVIADDTVPVDTTQGDTSNSPSSSITSLDTLADDVVPVDTTPGDTSNSPTSSTTSLDTLSDDVVAEFLTSIPTFTPTAGELEEVADDNYAAVIDDLTKIPTFTPTTVHLDESEDEETISQDTAIPTYFPSN